MTETNKIKILRLDVNLVLSLMRGRHYYEVINDALPSDASFVRGGHDNTGNILIVAHSEEFPEVPNGSVIPFLSYPVFEKLKEITFDDLKDVDTSNFKVNWSSKDVNGLRRLLVHLDQEKKEDKLTIKRRRK